MPGKLSPGRQVRAGVQPQGSHTPFPASESLSLESTVLAILLTEGVSTLRTQPCLELGEEGVLEEP